MITPYTWTATSVSDFWAAISHTRLAELNFARINGAKVIELVADHLTEASRILDYGAGDGHLIQALIDRGYPAGGLEFGEGRKLAELAASLEGNPRFLGLVDAESSELFEVILLIEVVEHVLQEDLATFFEMVRNKLHPGGIVIATTPNREDLDLSHSVCPQCHSVFHRWQHQRSFDKHSLESFFAPLDLETISIEGVDFSCNRLLVDEANRLAAEAAYWRWVALRPPILRLWDKLRGATGGRGRPDASAAPFRHAEGNLLYVGRKRG